MKKILILSYHFPSMNVIASQRALGYANHLKANGYYPTILTFDWDIPVREQFCKKSDFESKIKIEEKENYRVIRIPALENSFLQNMADKEGLFRYKLWVFRCWLTGRLDVHPLVEAFSISEWYYLDNYVKRGDYELVAGIFSPHFHLKNAYLLNKKIDIPYVLDYRDLWDNTILDEMYAPGTSHKLRDWSVKRYWKKYAKKANSLSTIGEVWVDKLKEITGNNNVDSIFNGFQNDIYSKDNQESRENDVFKISYTGTLYEWQEYKMMIDGLSLFLANCSEDDLDKVSVSFIGTKKQGGFSKVLGYLESQLNYKNVDLVSRVPKDETINIQRTSDVLLFATSPRVKGFYSGKIFEYISSGSLIFAGPQDYKGAADLISTTRTGKIFSSKEELSQYLSDAYNNWKSDVVLRPTNPDREKIAFYSRENQTRRFAEIITKSINS